MTNLQGNSNASKKNEERKKRHIDPVTANVKVRKESELKKLKNNFFTEDANSVKGHIFTNVIIPGIQRLLSDTVKNGIDWLIYGVRGSSDGRQQGGYRNISYTSYYDRNRSATYNSPGTRQVSTPTVYSVNQVTFVDRGEAEAVLMRLQEEIDRYGMVSVGDFYDMISQKSSYTDLNWGWKDLNAATVVRNRDGYSINFPTILTLG